LRQAPCINGLVEKVYFDETLVAVMPAKAGIQSYSSIAKNWIPACAGMTILGVHNELEGFQQAQMKGGSQQLPAPLTLITQL
jgi:hypothetical protein